MILQIICAFHQQANQLAFFQKEHYHKTGRLDPGPLLTIPSWHVAVRIISSFSTRTLFPLASSQAFGLVQLGLIYAFPALCKTLQTDAKSSYGCISACLNCECVSVHAGTHRHTHTPLMTVHSHSLAVNPLRCRLTHLAQSLHTMTSLAGWGGLRGEKPVLIGIGIEVPVPCIRGNRVIIGPTHDK